MNDLISIIIPVYNTEKYLKKCLESVIHQTYSNTEIIIVNDGSTDNSLEICNEYMEKDSRINVISQNNKGVSAARNLGLNYVKGKYILFVDSDDYLENTMIEILHRNIKDNDISICNYNKIYENRKKSGADDIGLVYLDTDAFMNDLLASTKYCGYLWNKLIRADIIKDVKFDENISIMEDLIFLSCISQNLKKAVYDSTSFLYNYVIRENSAMNSKKVNESILDAFEIMLELLNGYPLLKSKIFVDYISEAMFIKYKLKKQNKLTKEKKDYLNNIKNKYLISALKGKYYGFNKKIRLLILCYFNTIFFSIKTKKKN